MRDEITQSYSVGKIALVKAASKKPAAARTKAGDYVLRSLAGIKNKLKDASANAETRALLVGWVADQVADKSLPNHTLLKEELEEVLQ